jgi:hypothetical protein
MVVLATDEAGARLSLSNPDLREALYRALGEGRQG